MLKKIFSYSAVYGLGPFVPKIAGIFILPFITKYLTSFDYGIYGTLMAYLGAISAFKTLGLRVVLGNSYYHSPGMYKWLWRQVYGFLFIWNIPYSVFTCLLLLYAMPKEVGGNTWLVIALLVIPTMISGSSTTFGSLHYQLQQKPKPIAIRNIIFGLMNIGITFYTIAILKLGYLGWFIAMAITTICTNISYFIPLYFSIGIKPIFNYKWRLLRKSLKVSTPMIPHQYGYYFLNSSDRIVMDNVNISTAQIGNYSAAYTFGSYYAMGLEAMNQTLSPMFKAMYKIKDFKTVRDIGLLWLAFSLFLSFTICMFVKEIFGFLFTNPELAEYYYLAIFVIMAMNYRPIYATLVSRLFYFERTNIIWKITLLSGIINVILNIIFLKRFGVEAAAVTTFISFMVMTYIGFYYKNIKDLLFENYYPLTCLSATIAISLFARWAAVQDLNLRIIFALVGLIPISILFTKYKHVIKRVQNKDY